jgi:protocatechuate 4,5-dioxygenase beta chain
MAQLVGVLNTSHGPFTTLAPEKWEAMRQQRSYRSDVPIETEAERVEKHERAAKGLSILKSLLYECNPDVLVVFGDDQFENFDFNNYPTISVFAGEQFTGADNDTRGKPDEYHRVNGHPALGTAILTGLLQRNFDPGFMLGDSKPEHGMCHAVMRVLEFFDAYHLPVVPVLINGYYPPQATAVRAYQVGKAVREIIDSYPEDLRVVIIGSGGMWHTPGRPNSWLNEEFDLKLLDYLAKGDIRGMAEYFDAYEVPADDTSQDIGPNVRGMTGLPSLSGPQMGTRETCEWIGAAAAVEGKPFTVIDYIPIYASPIGTSFAYCVDI